MNKINKSILICSTVFCAVVQANSDEIFSSNFQFDSKIAFTSFEEPTDLPSGSKYFDSQPCTPHDLVNNTDQPYVDTIGIVTTELGFDASFTPPDGCGGQYDDGVDNDFLGITSFANNLTDIDDNPVGGYSDGVRGYQISDPDGTFTLISEVIDLTGRVNNSLTLDYFLDDRNHFDTPPSAGNWEPDDFLHIYVMDLTNSVTLDVVNLTGGIGAASEMDAPGVEYVWQSAVLMLPDNISIQIVIDFAANSGREVVYFDNIEVRGTD